MTTEQPLNAAHSAFVEKLLSDPQRNATRAYMAVYPNCAYNTARFRACMLMKDERIKALIAAKDEEIREANFLSRIELARHLAELVHADPRDLIEYRRGACRHCYGHNFRYQRTAGELEAAVGDYKRMNAIAAKKGLADLDPMAVFFDYAGGVGFNPTKPPNPDCPECFGQGVGYTHAKDVRDLPPAAARLFAGIKETREGFEIKMRSQDKALELAMRANGMLTPADDEDNVPPPSAGVTYEEIDASDHELERAQGGRG